MVLLVSKIVDDFLLPGTDNALRNFIKSFIKKFKLGEVVAKPGTLQSFGINLIQDEYLNVPIHADNKLNELETYPISRTCRRQIYERMIDIEKRAFMSITLLFDGSEIPYYYHFFFF